jgi:ABC-type branched-subunit amino acid transport system substrate-binding protein
MNNNVTAKALAGWTVLLALASTGVRAADIVLTQILPLTGPIAPNGQGLMAGAKAYIDSVNAAGGVRGHKIVLKTYDDQYKPAETVRLVEKSIAEDRPLAFFNFTGAANIELLIKTGDLEKNKIALIGPRAGTQSLRNPVNPLIFHTYSSYWDEVERMVELFSSMGTTRFAVLYQDDSFGTDGFEGVQAALKKRNLSLAVAAPYPRGTTDIAAAGAKIIAANPQAVIFCSTAPAAAAFVKRFRDQMVGVQFAGISAVDGATLVRLAGLNAAHGFVLAQNIPNPTKNSVALAREHHDAMAKFAPNVKPNFYTLGGYAAARVVVEGIRRAGPAPTREKFNAALEGLREFDIGGVQYTFGRGVRMGTKFVDLLIIDSKGEPQS